MYTRTPAGRAGGLRHGSIFAIGVVTMVTASPGCGGPRDDGPNDASGGFSSGGGGSGDGESGGSGESSESGGSGGPSSGGGDGDGGTSSGGTTGGGGGDGDGGIRLDVAGSGGSGPGEGGDGMGCQKVDFLFIVDSSGSMLDEQQSLIASFPGFIDTIRNTLDAQNYHVMVISTDDGTNTGLNSSCGNGACTCTPAPVCCENSCRGGNTCNGFDCNNLPIGPCDKTWGTGKQYDANGNSCNLADNRRYMLDSQPNVDQAFSCVANVGTYGGGDERPMLAMQHALSDALNDPGGCNEGFLRDDAILVITVITDEEDDNGGGMGSPGGPVDWIQTVIDAKAGAEEAAVVLALVGDSGVAGGICPPGGIGGGVTGAEDSPRLRQFAQGFTHGHVGSVCSADYSAFFEQAVSFIDASCTDFVPPG